MERFNLSDVQAQAICDMRLISPRGSTARSSKTSTRSLRTRYYFKDLLADPEKIKGVLKDELIALRDKYGDDRVTEIQDVADEIETSKTSSKRSSASIPLPTADISSACLSASTARFRAAAPRHPRDGDEGRGLCGHGVHRLHA